MKIEVTMCGIAGIIGKAADSENITQLIKKMSDTIQHRGPDDEGFHFDSDIALAFRRLSIIDLLTGHQPIYNEDKSLVIVFNGEIYNYQEIRDELIRKGHQFQTQTDTEIIVHAYEEKGVECLEDFNGMFAFCLWDSRNKQAFFARDRLGKKPLYYYQTSGSLIFSSEIKAILKTGLIKPEFSTENVNHYLSYRFTPAPYTPFTKIYKLPPAHFMIFKDNGITIKRYWQVKNFKKVNDTEREIIKQILNKLRIAVKRRLVSDVPLGLFLSGGVDSSAILAIMSEFLNEPVKTFTIGFDFSEDFQEYEYADRVAKLFKSDHHTMMINAQEFINSIPELVWFLDEPVADAAVIPLYFISRLAKKYITVALSGEGSDELFAGYARLYWYEYRRHKIKKWLQILPAFTRSEKIQFIFQKIRPDLQHKFDFINNPVTKDKIISMGNYFSTEQKKELFQEKYYQNIQNKDSYIFIEDILKEFPHLQYLDRKLMVDLFYWLPDDLLIKADRATMANSVELRIPFLDHELVEYAFRIKDNLKIRRGKGKIILKKAFLEILPREIIERPKMGFPVPLSGWFANELKPQVTEILLGEKSARRGIFVLSKIKELIDNHQPGKNNLSGFIWILLIFEIWCRIFIDGEDHSTMKIL